MSESTLFKYLSAEHFILHFYMGSFNPKLDIYYNEKTSGEVKTFGL